MVVCFAIVTILALGMVIRPATWVKPCNLAASEADVKSSSADYDLFLIANAITHREATEVNQETLDTKVRVLRYMVWAALLELAAAMWQFFVASG